LQRCHPDAERKDLRLPFVASASAVIRQFGSNFSRLLKISSVFRISLTSARIIYGRLLHFDGLRNVVRITSWHNASTRLWHYLFLEDAETEKETIVLDFCDLWNSCFCLCCAHHSSIHTSPLLLRGYLAARSDPVSVHAQRNIDNGRIVAELWPIGRAILLPPLDSLTA
jgi:hypothetical protein